MCHLFARCNNDSRDSKYYLNDIENSINMQIFLCSFWLYCIAVVEEYLVKGMLLWGALLKAIREFHDILVFSDLGLPLLYASSISEVVLLCILVSKHDCVLGWNHWWVYICTFIYADNNKTWSNFRESRYIRWLLLELLLE